MLPASSSGIGTLYHLDCEPFEEAAIHYAHVPGSKKTNGIYEPANAVGNSTHPADADGFFVRDCSEIDRVLSEDALQRDVAIKVVMGDYTDYFRPIVSEYSLGGQVVSLCDMLQASNQHQWSANGFSYATPRYVRNWNWAGQTGMNYGGSANQDPFAWPERPYLSFWGSANPRSDVRGGCCKSSMGASSSQGSWGHTFDIYVSFPWTHAEYSNAGRRLAALGLTASRAAPTIAAPKRETTTGRLESLHRRLLALEA